MLVEFYLFIFFNPCLLAGRFDWCKLPKNCQIQQNLNGIKKNSENVGVADPQVVELKWLSAKWRFGILNVSFKRHMLLQVTSQ